MTARALRLDGYGNWRIDSTVSPVAAQAAIRVLARSDEDVQSDYVGYCGIRFIVPIDAATVAFYVEEADNDRVTIPALKRGGKRDASLAQHERCAVIATLEKMEWSTYCKRRQRQSTKSVTAWELVAQHALGTVQLEIHDAGKWRPILHRGWYHDRKNWVKELQDTYDDVVSGTLSESEEEEVVEPAWIEVGPIERYARRRRIMTRRPGRRGPRRVDRSLQVMLEARLETSQPYALPAALAVRQDVCVALALRELWLAYRAQCAINGEPVEALHFTWRAWLHAIHAELEDSPANRRLIQRKRDNQGFQALLHELGIQTPINTASTFSEADWVIHP